MASDVFVRWKDGKRPTEEEVANVIRDFFSDVLTEIVWKKDRFFLTLVGKNSHPLRRVGLGHQGLEPKHLPPVWVLSEPEPGFEERHMEVWLSEDCLDVLTRRQDEFTHACQDGLAKVFARFWQGEIER